MAKNSIRDFSATAGSNTDIQSINIDEGCAASNLNNAVRELMADLKDVSTGTIALESPQADSLTVSGDLTVSGTSSLGTGQTDYIQAIGGSGTARVDAVGGNTNVNLSLSAKGTGSTYFWRGGYGGTASMFIDGSSGNVGIGTSSPTNAKLEISNSTDSIESIRVNDSRSTPSTNKRSVDIRYTGTNGRTNSHTELLYLYDGNASSTSPFIKVDGSISTHLVLDSSGNLLVGRTSSLYGTERLHVYNTTNVASFWCDTSSDLGALFIRHERASGGTTAEMIAFKASGGGTVGSIRSSGSSTSYNTSSDYRLKENITEVTGAADRVKALNPVRFNFIADPDTTVDGFLAHEVQDIVPEAVTGAKDAMRDEEYEVTPAVEATYDDEGNVLTEAVPAVMGIRSVPDYQGIDQSKLVPLLTAALQEALTKIDDLESRLSALETA